MTGYIKSLLTCQPHIPAHSAASLPPPQLLLHPPLSITELLGCVKTSFFTTKETFFSYVFFLYSVFNLKETPFLIRLYKIIVLLGNV